jgi:hypothetical protein
MDALNWTPMPTITFEVTEQELQIIARALAGQPYGVVAHLIAKLQEQHKAQLDSSAKE